MEGVNSCTHMATVSVKGLRKSQQNMHCVRHTPYSDIRRLFHVC